MTSRSGSPATAGRADRAWEPGGHHACAGSSLVGPSPTHSPQVRQCALVPDSPCLASVPAAWQFLLPCALAASGLPASPGLHLAVACRLFCSSVHVTRWGCCTSDLNPPGSGFSDLQNAVICRHRMMARHSCRHFSFRYSVPSSVRSSSLNSPSHRSPLAQMKLPWPCFLPARQSPSKRSPDFQT